MVVQILLSFNPAGEFCAPEFTLNNSLSRAGVFAPMGRLTLRVKVFRRAPTSRFAQP
jgi:hypothetical protein